MVWMSNVFAALVLMDITGTVFFIVGLIFGKVWFDNDVRWLRFQTMAVLIAYGAPFVYLVLCAEQWLASGRKAGSWANLFANTPITRQVFAVLGCAWIAMFLGLLLYRLYRYLGWMQVCKGNIPEEDEEVQELFDSICAELGISGKVTLCRNDSVNIACVTYHHGPVVILPFERYGEREISVILYHELCHYVEHDILFKTFAIVISLLHVFNPAVHILLEQMTLLCEESCDRLACEKGKEKYSERQYFQIVFDMLTSDRKRERYQLFSLADTASRYERRLKSMKKYHEKRYVKKGAVLVLSACFLLGSSMTALAAGEGLTDTYEDVAVESSEQIDEAIEQQILEELSAQYDLDSVNIVWVGDEGIAPCGHTPINWVVPANTIYTTVTGFKKNVGETVSIALSSSPESIEIHAGLQRPDLTMRYVKAGGTIGHTFTIDQDGKHYFYVYNPDQNNEVTVDGSVVY